MSTAAVTIEAVPQEKKSVPICEHIKDNGFRCGSPAIRSRHFCYNHSRAHAPSRLGTRYYRAPVPETVESLQLTIQHITEALGAGVITDKAAGKLLYAVQLATNLLKMSKAERIAVGAVGAPFKPSVGLSGVVDGIVDGVVGPQVDSKLETRNSQLESASNQPVTELSPAMEQALAPRVVEPIDEPALPPKPITRKEFDELLRQIMTDQERAALLPAIEAGDDSPAYNRATRYLSAHYDALQRLQDAGIHRDDPRLQRFFEPRAES